MLSILFSANLFSQTHIHADPQHLLLSEYHSFKGSLPLQSNFFRPIFYKTDSTSLSVRFMMETYLNNNAPNQENMDVRYFSKGMSYFNSLQLSINNPYFLFMAEPYIKIDKFQSVNAINRNPPFSVLNDKPLSNKLFSNSTFRNLLAFIHYKGFGFGWHMGNRWWGPGIHTSFQMTNNTRGIPAHIIGTMQEIRIRNLGFYLLYTFANLNNEKGIEAKYFTSLNGRLTWYGPIFISAGFSRNYLTGGELSPSGYFWKESDAKKIVFEGFFISNLIEAEHTLGGSDRWDQTLSGYLSITLPKRNLKLYTEIGFNDNRMYFADFLSQPDHSMATIFGVRDYGVGPNKNWIWGFEWTNLMITYTSRHRGEGGAAPWYERGLYDYSTYEGRRWAAHSGADSDDWYLYLGYLSDNLMIINSLNYERHGIVSHRPAEVKTEFGLNIRYKYSKTWFSIYYEKQFEAFLGFPKNFYVDIYGSPTGYANRHKLINTRNTNTLILSISKKINF